MYNLKIITSTVRPGRKGPIVAKWVKDLAVAKGIFSSVELIDLGELKLPMMDEPAHPILRQYTHEHTKKWSKTIDEADAFIFITAEYDYNYPAPLHNALEYLVHEWAYKAAGIVSYGGVSAGTRAYNNLKNDLITLQIVPVAPAVHLPFFDKSINDQNEFVPGPVSDKAADSMFNSIVRWTKGLKIIKENK